MTHIAQVADAGVYIDAAARPSTGDADQVARLLEGARAIRAAQGRAAAVLTGASRGAGSQSFATFVARVLPADAADLSHVAACVLLPTATVAALRDGELAPDELAPPALVGLGRALGLDWVRFHALIVPCFALGDLPARVGELEAIWRADEQVDAL